MFSEESTLDLGGGNNVSSCYVLALFYGLAVLNLQIMAPGA